MNENKNPNGERLLSVKALSQILSVSKRTCHRLNISAKLPAPIRIGGSIRWRQSDIEQFLKHGFRDRREFEAFRDMADGGKHE